MLRTRRIAFFLVLLAACGSEGSDAALEIKRFSATPLTVAPGQRVTLSWEVAGAEEISITAAGAAPVIVTSGSGTLESAPLDRDTNFTLIAKRGAQSAMRAVLVTLALAEVEIKSFEASTMTVLIGETVELSWQTSGAGRLTISDPLGTIYTAEAGAIDAGSFTTPPIAAEATPFLLRASNDAETKTAEVTIVGLSPPVIDSFTAAPGTFTATTTDVTLSWSAQNALTLALFANGTAVPSFMPAGTENGSFTINIAETTTFELVATTLSATTSASARVVHAVAEVEPNDDFDRATDLSEGAGAGEITMGDVDYWFFTVPNGGSVFAETSDGAGGCAFDSIITLYDETETALGSADDLPPMGGGGGGGGGGGMGMRRLCSRIDPLMHPFATNLAAGTYFIAVEGKNGAAGAYVLTLIISAQACGNGIIEGTEQCDDGNMLAGDQCSPSCSVEVAGSITAPGGMIDVAVQPDGLAIVEVVLTAAGQSIEAIAQDMIGLCTIESTIILRDRSRRILAMNLSDVEADECAELGFPSRLGNIDLPVGSYYLEIENDSLMPALFRVVVTVHDPGCGNGAIERSLGEQCEDGNTVAGDGCSDTCRYEVLDTVSGPPAETVFSGSLSPLGRRELYELVLTAPGYIEAETFVPMPETCTGTAADTVLELYDAALDRPLDANDDGLNNGPCSELLASGAIDLRPAGTYYLLVRAFAGTEVPNYAVRVRLTAAACGNGIVELQETCDDGNLTAGDGCDAVCQFEGTILPESEPNNSLAEANDSGASMVLISGAIVPLGDEDVFRVQVTALMGAISAQTHTSPNDVEACAGADTLIELVDANGLLIARDDDDGASVCSRLDSSLDPQVAGLPAGDYFLRVKHFDGTGTIPGYYLSLRVF